MGSSLPLVLIEPLTHERGPVPGLSIRALGSWSPVGTVQDRPSRQARRSLPLVLIKRLAHVRGGCTPGNSRLGQLASLVLIKRLTRVRAVGREKFSSRGWALLNFLELIYLSQKGAPFPAPHGLR